MILSARLALLAVALVAAGCGEREQTATVSKKTDEKPWHAGGSNVAGNWKAGDQKAWEEHLRARAQGQNEYSRSASSTSNP